MSDYNWEVRCNDCSQSGSYSYQPTVCPVCGSSCINTFNISNNGCFAGVTSISTPHGVRQIQDIEEGSPVYSCSDSGFVIDHVLKRKVVKPSRLWNIHLLNTKIPIQTTQFHLFLTNTGWKPTLFIKPNDKILSVQNDRVVAIPIANVEKTQTKELVYNLITKDTQCYIANNVIVSSFTFFHKTRKALARYTNSRNQESIEVL